MKKLNIINDVITEIENRNYENFTDLSYDQLKNNIKTLASDLNEEV